MEDLKDILKVEGISDITAGHLSNIGINTPEELINMGIDRLFAHFKKLKDKNKLSYQVSIKSIKGWIENAKTGDYKYYHTIQLYNSLIDRNFDKIFRIVLFKHIILNNEENPIINDLSFSKNDKDLFKKSFKNMTTLRGNNKRINKWEKSKDGKKIIQKLWENYKKEFSKKLNLNDFKKLYGEDFSDRECEYCNIKESEIQKLIKHNKIITKRLYSRGKKMEIDKKDPNGYYTSDNIILSCYWCNNAKTDEFFYDEFKDIIGKSIKQIWTKRLQEI